ncbi:MAG: 50S ribosomal protein L22 [Pirellulales bacterium]
MAYTAVHRFARISARKVRALADLIRGKRADSALDILKYQPHRGARMLERVLRSAMSNAEDRRAADIANLMVVDAQVDGGPMFKRVRPRARGMAFMVLRRMAHIRVSVDNKKVKESKVKESKGKENSKSAT